MAKHSRGSGGNPPPDPFQPADEDAFEELQEDFPASAEALAKFHGDPDQLATALENSFDHLVEADRDEARRLVWESMGITPPGENPPEEE